MTEQGGDVQRADGKTFSLRRSQPAKLKLKSHRREGTKKGRPATTIEDVLVLALIVLVALDVVIALGFGLLWGLTG